MQTWKSSSASSVLWAFTSCRDLHSACFSALTSTCTASAPASIQLTWSVASALDCSPQHQYKAGGCLSSQHIACSAACCRTEWQTRSSALEPWCSCGQGWPYLLAGLGIADGDALHLPGRCHEAIR